MEVWKKVPYYKNYEVSSHGRVRNTNTGEFLKPQTSKRGGGYPFVNLYKRGKRKNKNIHSLVARAFLGKTPDGMVVHHKDKDRKNPKLENLQHITHKDNNWRNHEAFCTGSEDNK